MAETLYAQGVTVAAYIDAGIMEVLRTTNVMLNLGYRVTPKPGSNAMKLRSKAGQTAAVVSENAEATVATYSHTAGNTLTAKKIMVLNEISKEAELFTDIDLAEMRLEQGLAISEKIDTDMAALFTGFSNSVGTTATALTPDLLLQAMYKVRLGNVPGPVIGVLHPTQLYHVQGNIITQGATPWANPTLLDLLGAQPALANGFRGSIFGMPIFETQHTPSANAAVDWAGAVLNPVYAIAFLDVGASETLIEPDTSKRTRQVSTDFFYDCKERNDAAGCQVISKQAA